MTVDEHHTYVARDSQGTYYWWCTADDCYAAHRHYAYEAEAAEAAANHERHPG